MTLDLQAVIIIKISSNVSAKMILWMYTSCTHLCPSHTFYTKSSSAFLAKSFSIKYCGDIRITSSRYQTDRILYCLGLTVVHSIASLTSTRKGSFSENHEKFFKKKWTCTCTVDPIVRNSRKAAGPGVS